MSDIPSGALDAGESRAVSLLAYTRDFPVEQYWRDNRLNMIHEGTHGIQALDLLGRKVVMQGGAGLAAVRRRIEATWTGAWAVPELQ